MADRRALADHEPLRDLAIGEALGDEREHLALSVREAQNPRRVVLAQPELAGQPKHPVALDRGGDRLEQAQGGLDRGPGIAPLRCRQPREVGVAEREIEVAADRLQGGAGFSEETARGWQVTLVERDPAPGTDGERHHPATADPSADVA